MVKGMPERIALERTMLHRLRGLYQDKTRNVGFVFFSSSSRGGDNEIAGDYPEADKREYIEYEKRDYPVEFTDNNGRSCVMDNITPDTSPHSIFHVACSAGFEMGKHYHPDFSEDLYLISGACTLIMYDPGGEIKKPGPIDMRSGQMVNIGSGVPHSATYPEESHLLLVLKKK